MSSDKDQPRGDLTSQTETGAGVPANLLTEQWSVRHEFGYPAGVRELTASYLRTPKTAQIKSSLLSILMQEPVS
jgi:hypothetical protein